MSRHPSTLRDEGAAVRAATAAFYRAFEQRDHLAMAAVWSEELPALCVHPGWPPLVTLEEIAASWRAIFRGTRYLEVEFEERGLDVRGDLAWVHGVETVRQAGARGETRGVVATTNVWRREVVGWRLCVHHASAIP